MNGLFFDKNALIAKEVIFCQHSNIWYDWEIKSWYKHCKHSLCICM